MDCRQAFEQWFTNEGESPNAIKKNSSGIYYLMQAQTSWQAWQAAWNHPRTTVTSAGEILEDGVLRTEAWNG